MTVVDFDLNAKFWPSKNNARCVVDRYFRPEKPMSGESAEGGPGSASRGSYIYVRITQNEVSEDCLTRLGAVCSMLRYYGVPRRISLGFAHSAAAAGDGRRGGRTQHVPVGKPFAFPVSSGCCTRILAELRHIAYIYDEFRMRQRVSGGKSGADRPQNAYIYTHVSGHWQRRRAVRNVQAGWRAGWAGWAGGRAAWLTGGRR